jgi:spermidine synthase
VNSNGGTSVLMATASPLRLRSSCCIRSKARTSSLKFTTTNRLADCWCSMATFRPARRTSSFTMRWRCTYRCWGASAKTLLCLKHDFVTSVTMVEIDQRVVDLASEYLAVNGDYKDPRVTLIIDNAANFVSQAVKDGKRFDLIVLDLTEPVGPSSCLFTEKFLTEVVSLVSETGVILDSDSIYLSKKGGDFLQEVSGEGDNLVTVMQRTKILPHIDVYHTNIPLYPGADFGFFLYSRDGVSLRHPVKPFEGKHYNAEVHTASFALPNWQKEWLMPKG